jgi:hypothetical protein
MVPLCVTVEFHRHGTTSLFAALNTGTGQVVADCRPRRTAVELLAFVKGAVKPHAGKEIHVVSDNLSTHDTPETQALLTATARDLPFHPVGSSWINHIET